ncbi:cache domain-containing sensor histidine kinase [Bacillus sp. REN16]|uniref:cache domain-containing sensor histidine kinase n=1 Tax=Bacillus sp. REN16 TaxID=2887296 RepID=UPI001E61D9B2|nr:sensor histidine kinase [Bacillus sp. REN16]MCC3356789.1 sensor histidine kinase [Bacillus sp. REN16]
MKNFIQINNLPIRYKLISHFLIISVIPIICLGMLINWTVGRVVEEQVNKNTLQLISKVNESLEFHLTNMQRITYFISYNNRVQEFFDTKNQMPVQDQTNEFEIQRYLRNFTTLSPEIAGILLVNTSGKYVSNELYAPDSTNLTEESWYKEAIENKGIFKIIGQPKERRISSLVNYKNNEVVTVVRAIMDPITQDVLGVVLIDLKVRTIAETLVDVRLGKTGYLTAIDDQNRAIYQPDDPLIETIPNEWFEGKKSGTFSKEVNSQKLQFIYQKSPYSNWTVIGVFPTKETIYEISEIQFYLVVFVFIILLFGIAVSYVLSISISKPIGQLMTFMRKAEGGELGVRYIEKRDDEIGMLGRSFNKMLKQINELLRLTERHERQKREAEFRSLQANINPHFLYNTLDTIQWMARKQKATDIAEVVESLAKLFRIGLSKGRDIITLDKEIEHIESYLRIQKTRYREKLLYQIDVDEGLGSLYVLKFILQPLIENAIYHGIKERRGPGQILVTARQDKEKLLLAIQDNGAGMSESQLHEIRLALTDAVRITENQGESKNQKGYGILNVQARILLAFGHEYGITIESSENTGTKIELVLPILEKDFGWEEEWRKHA